MFGAQPIFVEPPNRVAPEMTKAERATNALHISRLELGQGSRETIKEFNQQLCARSH